MSMFGKIAKCSGCNQEKPIFSGLEDSRLSLQFSDELLLSLRKVSILLKLLTKLPQYPVSVILV